MVWLREGGGGGSRSCSQQSKPHAVVWWVTLVGEGAVSSVGGNKRCFGRKKQGVSPWSTTQMAWRLGGNNRTLTNVGVLMQ